MSLNNIDYEALQERLRIEQEVEAEMSATADAKSGTFSWHRIQSGDMVYARHLILALGTMAHGKAVAINWR